MKLLVVSHACVADVNQALYADVARLSGWNVDLVVPSSWKNDYGKQVEPARWKTFQGEIRPIPVVKSGSIPLHLYRRTMVGLLRRVRPDIIYVHHEPYGAATAQLYLANRLAGRVPIGFYAAQNIFKRYPQPFRWTENQVLRHSDFAFPVTQGALDVLREKGYTGRAEVLPLALDPELYRPRNEWSESKRKELGLSVDTVVFGYLGRFVEEKGLLNLVRAAAHLRGHDWRLLFVGSGSLAPKLKALIAACGIEHNVMFHDFVPHHEVPCWLSLFNVLMIPSETRSNWKEQFGRVIVEANACETAVIGTDSGEIANLLKTTGGGLIVPEANVDALTAAMSDMLNHPGKIQDLARTGADTVAENYGQERLARRFIHLLEDALQDRTHAAGPA